MNIGLVKIKEDGEVVSYRAFLSDVYEEDPLNRGSYICVTKNATLLYNKNNHNIEYVWENTDGYYKQHKNIADHMRVLVLGKMMKCNREGYFPEKTGVATG